MIFARDGLAIRSTVGIGREFGEIRLARQSVELDWATRPDVNVGQPCPVLRAIGEAFDEAR